MKFFQPVNYWVIYIELEMYEAAFEAYEHSLVSHQHRFNSVSGAARAADKMGDAEAAMKYYQQLVEMVGDVNSDREELKAAEAYISLGTI